MCFLGCNFFLKIILLSYYSSLFLNIFVLDVKIVYTYSEYQVDADVIYV